MRPVHHLLVGPSRTKPSWQAIVQLVAKGTFVGPVQTSGLMSPFAIRGKGSHFTATFHTTFSLNLLVKDEMTEALFLTFARDFQAVPAGQWQTVAHLTAAKLVTDVAPELAARVDRVHGGVHFELMLIVLVMLASHAAVRGCA